MQKNVRKVFIWSSADRIGQSVLHFLVSILLARLLTPDDFGLMGGVLLFIAVAYVVVDCGLGKALARQRDAGDRHYSTVFFANLILAALLYSAAFCLAPLIAGYMAMSELKAIIRILFLSLFFNALYIVPHTRLQMSFRFDRIACVNLLSNALSAIVAVVAAFNGAGVWALVVQQMTYHAVRMAGFVIAAPRWRLTMPSMPLLGQTLRFSIPIALTGLLNAVFGNIYLFVVAKFFPLWQTGQYTHAHRQADTANFSIIAILESTTYNLLAELRHDDRRFGDILSRLLQRVNIIAMPLMMLIIVIAVPACRLLFGGQWLPSVPYFRIICLANIPSALSLLITNALNVKGFSRETFYLELFRKTAIGISVAVCIPWGISALLWGYAAACYAGLIAQMAAMHKLIDYPVVRQLRDIAPAACLTALTALLLLVG